MPVSMVFPFYFWPDNGLTTTHQKLIWISVEQLQTQVERKNNNERQPRMKIHAGEEHTFAVRTHTRHDRNDKWHGVSVEMNFGFLAKKFGRPKNATFGEYLCVFFLFSCSCVCMCLGMPWPNRRKNKGYAINRSNKLQKNFTWMCVVVFVHDDDVQSVCVNE